MTKIKLYGELGHKFGQSHSYHMDRLSEFGSAMEANFPGFRKFFIECSQKNKAYSLFVDGKLIEDKIDLHSRLALKPTEIVVLPVVAGSAYIIPTIVYLVELYGAWAAANVALSTIIELVVYAVISAVVSSIFAPKPKSSLQTSTANAGLNSYYFGGRENKAQQGQPVPIVYGHLRVGSYVIQAGLRNLDKDDFEDLDNGDSTEIPTGTFI